MRSSAALLCALVSSTAASASAGTNTATITETSTRALVSSAAASASAGTATAATQTSTRALVSSTAASASAGTTTATVTQTSTLAGQRAAFGVAETSSTSAAPQMPPKRFLARLSFGLSGSLLGTPLAPGPTETWRGRTTYGGEFDAQFGLYGWEFVTAVGGARFARRRAGPPSQDVQSRGADLYARFGLRFEVDDVRDGAGVLFGTQVGLRFSEATARTDLTDPACPECPALFDRRLTEGFFTVAVVPSLTYRHLLYDDGFRVGWEMEGLLWLGGISHGVSFRGDPTPAGTRAFEAAQQGRLSNFYAALELRTGFRFGYAKRIESSKSSKSSRGFPYQPNRYQSPPPPPPPPSRW